MREGRRERRKEEEREERREGKTREGGRVGGREEGGRERKRVNTPLSCGYRGFMLLNSLISYYNCGVTGTI